MSESIPPLDPDLLGALRDAEPAPAVVRARARQRLMSAVGGVGGGSGGGGGGGAAGGSGQSMAPGMPRAIAFVLGGVVGVGLYVALAPAPAARVVYVDRIVPAPPTAPLATAATVTAVAAGEGSTAGAATPPTTPSAASPTGASQLSAERILLDEARAAIAQGDPARALDRLERHRRTFPVPLLGEERDAMWVQALVKAGRYDEARSHAAAFRKRSPDSLFSSVVDSAIDSIP
ncbi:MAG TPA: hypothetical protein VK762_31825 [Polyangiaceae bacterium]|nr:hypothetical protein [Polyangiaceae bacterium]